MNRKLFSVLLRAKLKSALLLLVISTAAFFLLFEERRILSSLASQSSICVEEMSQMDLWAFLEKGERYEEKLSKIAALPEVLLVTPLIQFNERAYGAQGKSYPCTLLGIEENAKHLLPKLNGGSWQKAFKEDGAIIDDRSKSLILSPHKKIDFVHESVTAVGSTISQSGHSNFLIYTSLGKAKKLLEGREALQALMIKVQPGCDLAKAKARIEESSSLQLFTPKQFIRHLAHLSPPSPFTPFIALAFILPIALLMSVSVALFQMQKSSFVAFLAIGAARRDVYGLFALQLFALLSASLLASLLLYTLRMVL